jgi:outer membrane murein-binding lipoprotein Lpp
MRVLVILAASVFIAGCGGTSEEDTVGKEIADDYNEAMDKAREVEDKLLQHKEDIDKAMEEADEANEKEGTD